MAVTSAPLGGPATTQARNSFPCRWNWQLATNQRPGYALAGANADCAGRAGSLTITVRLQHQDPQAHQWRTLKAAARRFHDLRRSRFVEVAERCASTAVVTYRATFTWTLRNPRGSVVSHLTYTAGPVALGC